ncbi:MAG TPA: DNA-processing protein DprA [Actinomycetota bacterium]|nr:DNA-processing protein DprA [Actinomycetota bacterium]
MDAVAPAELARPGFRTPASLLAARRVVRGEPGYPALLDATPGAPAELFVAGKPLEPAPHVAIVGTRRASRYGLEVAGWLGRDLAAAGVVVVSGMAAGIDGAAHRGALGAGATAAVLGSGLDICYPRRNAGLYRDLIDRGTLVSEFPAGTMPAPWRFPARNRIIAGLSLGVVIVEARRDGGAMITARLAAEFGREVFAVAGPVHAPGSEGPHALIRDGARLVSSAADVLEDLGLGRPEAPLRCVQLPLPVIPLTPDERLILEVVQAEPMLLDRIARLAGLPAASASSTLSRLEIAGLVSRRAGGRFALPVEGPR